MQVFWGTGIERLKTIHIICYYGLQSFLSQFSKTTAIMYPFHDKNAALEHILGPWKKTFSNLRKVDFLAGQVTFKAY